ncbi:MAG: prephenate dehydrogenase/arogenate dehydrogenase family protein [Pseudomonadales bacterium]|nr:prephenate dehydrogenase/arogenate dehydrogenase family protein [Pseudomonadales bacterium]
MEPHFRRVAIIGLGLIGASLAASLKRFGLAGHIVAFDGNGVSLKEGLEMGLIDSTAISARKASQGADLVVLAVPVLAMEAVFKDIKPVLDKEGVIVTDVGSVKCVVLDAATRVLGRLPGNLVPGHPIAGSERHGVTAADPNLFAHHKIILTPRLQTDGEATRRIREMWQAMDADVVEMDPEHHDTILAQTSHLPHLLAFALIDTLSQLGDTFELFEYAAGGFRDFSRIAASDPIMWRDVFATNSAPVLEILDRYMDDLGRLRQMIASGNLDDLANVFARSKAARDHFSRIIEQREIKRKSQ